MMALDTRDIGEYFDACVHTTTVYATDSSTKILHGEGKDLSHTLASDVRGVFCNEK